MASSLNLLDSIFFTVNMNIFYFYIFSEVVIFSIELPVEDWLQTVRDVLYVFIHIYYC